MAAAWVVAVFLALMAGLVSLTASVKGDTDRNREATLVADQVAIAEGVDAFQKLHGRTPNDLDELVSADGFEHLRASRNRWQRYERSGTLNDGTWNFQRTATWTAARADGGSTYRDENSCGTGSVTTAQAWCGASDGSWYRTETKEQYNQQMSSQRSRQMRTLQHFADYWSANQAFPFVGNDGVQLGVGQQRTLASLAGYTGTALGCSGVYVWRGIPLDCGSMFDSWGQPVRYQYQAPTLVILSTETPFTAANGSAVIVATPLQVQE